MCAKFMMIVEKKGVRGPVEKDAAHKRLAAIVRGEFEIVKSLGSLTRTAQISIVRQPLVSLIPS